jgi:hypothetical protein
MNHTKSKIFELLFFNVRRDGVSDLLRFLFTSDFFTAPASTKHHLSGEGGLAEHSLNVFNCLYNYYLRYDLKVPFESVVLTAICHDLCKVNFYIPDTEMASEKQMNYLRALSNQHAGKRCTPEEIDFLKDGFKFWDATNKTDSPWTKDHASKMIDWLANVQPGVLPNADACQKRKIDDVFPCGHGEKSVMILQQYIKLEPFEMAAIRFHMGAFTPLDYTLMQSYNAACEKWPLVPVLHIADMEASNLVEREELTK